MDRSSGIWIALGVAGIVVAGFVTVRRLSPRMGQLASELQATSDTIEPQYGAVDRRHREQRAAIASMRADLLRLVAAESVYAADSGFPTVNIPASYFRPSPRSMVTITITRNGWWARMEHQQTPITCAIVIGPDTTIGDGKPGEPVCLGWRD